MTACWKIRDSLNPRTADLGLTCGSVKIAGDIREHMAWTLVFLSVLNKVPDQGVFNFAAWFEAQGRFEYAACLRWLLCRFEVKDSTLEAALDQAGGHPLRTLTALCRDEEANDPGLRQRVCQQAQMPRLRFAY